MILGVIFISFHNIFKPLTWSDKNLTAEPPWYVIRMPGGEGGLLSDGESYPD